MSVPSGLARAVLDGDILATKNWLSGGASPNECWGTIDLLTHAARQLNTAMFTLLLSHGATVPKSLLPDLISWELYDYIISTDEEEDSLLSILDMIEPTEAWLSIDERRLLVQKLDGHLTKVAERLLETRNDT